MGGGAPSNIGRRPHEPDVCLPEGSPLLGDLEAHARTVQGPCRPGLDGLPLPRSARRRTKREAQRNVQAFSTIAEDAGEVTKRRRWEHLSTCAMSASHRPWPRAHIT